MAGRPITRGYADLLEEIGEETLMDCVLQGMTVRDIVRLFGVNVSGYYMWLDREEGRRDRFVQARAAYAEHLDSEGMQIADDVPEDRDSIQKAKLRVEQRRHVAANMDKTRQQSGSAQTVVNIAHLHLEAVRARMNRLPSKVGEPVPEAEYEVEDE